MRDREFIIQSRLDTDIYKLYVQQFVYNNYPTVTAEFEFRCRSPKIDFSPYITEIREEIEHLCELRYTADELHYLYNLGIFSNSFLGYLETEQIKMKNVMLGCYGKELGLRAAGLWSEASAPEIPFLSIVEEVYFRHNGPDLDKEHDVITEAFARVRNKMALALANKDIFKFSDFGTRRRYSRSWQHCVLSTIQQSGPDTNKVFMGTSNPWFSMKANTRPMGSQPHELYQAMQALVPIRDSIRATLEKWLMEWRGKLGIALTDILGFDAFLRDFDVLLAKAYDGCRQDSGDPILWGEKLIGHYGKLGIDPMTKTAVFSDGLDFPKAIEIAKHFKGRINTMFGIGTNLQNDIPGVTPLQIVMKMVKCNGQPVIKLSDSPGKVMCRDEAYAAWVKKVFDINQ